MMNTNEVWNIWKIENRWARAAAVWVAVPFVALISIAAVLVTVVVSAFKGAYLEIKYVLAGLADEWERDKETLAHIWAAMRGKEAP